MDLMKPWVYIRKLPTFKVMKGENKLEIFIKIILLLHVFK